MYGRHVGGVGNVAALQLQGPLFDLELSYNLCEALYVLPMFVWIYSGFSGFLQKCRLQNAPRCECVCV